MVNSELIKGNKTSTFKDLGDWRVTVNSNLKRWFSRNIGEWRSRRQYFFDNEEVMNLEMFLRIENIKDLEEEEDSRYRFTWWSEQESEFFIKKPKFAREGTIEISLLGHQIHRSNSYLDDSPGISSIKQVDEHELIFESNYQNWHIQENTRLIDEDRYRSRNIYSWENNKLKIVENHHEIRIY